MENRIVIINVCIVLNHSYSTSSPISYTRQKEIYMHAPPEIFGNESALRCNLVHFETEFWQMLQCVHWPRRVWMIFPLQLPIYSNDNIFFLGGGGANFYPSNTLDRTLRSLSSKSILDWTTGTIVKHLCTPSPMLIHVLPRAVLRAIMALGSYNVAAKDVMRQIKSAKN